MPSSVKPSQITEERLDSQALLALVGMEASEVRRVNGWEIIHDYDVVHIYDEHGERRGVEWGRVHHVPGEFRTPALMRASFVVAATLWIEANPEGVNSLACTL